VHYVDYFTISAYDPHLHVVLRVGIHGEVPRLPIQLHGAQRVRLIVTIHINKLQSLIHARVNVHVNMEIYVAGYPT
jgi:ABC-type thiamine transport system ATPase subunit